MKLLVKSALFALFSQGVFAVLVPLLLAGERSVAGAWSLALAACLFAVGIVVYARCTWDFARFGRGTPSPFDGPRRLVTRGLYRHIRNPMYMAALALIAGWAALFASVPVAIYAAAVSPGGYLRGGGVRVPVVVNPLLRGTALDAKVRRRVFAISRADRTLAARPAAKLGRFSPGDPSTARAG